IPTVEPWAHELCPLSGQIGSLLNTFPFGPLLRSKVHEPMAGPGVYWVFWYRFFVFIVAMAAPWVFLGS
ncbi:MAG: hypothetical protein ACLQMS_11665, partial [Desulfomonilaceae bacterium]